MAVKDAYPFEPAQPRVGRAAACRPRQLALLPLPSLRGALRIKAEVEGLGAQDRRQATPSTRPPVPPRGKASHRPGDTRLSVTD